MFIKEFNYSGSEAHTLDPSSLEFPSNGWVVEGEVHTDYYSWVNEFKAEHPKYGKVWGDFEKVVYADSEEGYESFIKSHPPIMWDYGDI